MFSLLSTSPNFDGAVYSAAEQGFGDYRHLMSVEVSALAQHLRGLPGSGAVVAHIHDYSGDWVANTCATRLLDCVLALIAVAQIPLPRKSAAHLVLLPTGDFCSMRRSLRPRCIDLAHGLRCQRG